MSIFKKKYKVKCRVKSIKKIQPKTGGEILVDFEPTNKVLNDKVKK